MIIKCPSCDTKFNLPDEKFQEGRKVRCSQCKEVFALTFDPELNPAMAAPAAPAPAAAPAAPTPPAQPETPAAPPAPEAPAASTEADAFFGDEQESADAASAGMDDGAAEAKTSRAIADDEAADDDGVGAFSDPTPGSAAAAYAKSDASADAAAGAPTEAADDGFAKAMAQEAGEDPYSIDIGETPKKSPKPKLTIARGQKTKKKSPLKLAMTLFLIILLAVGAAGMLAWIFAPDMIPASIREMLGGNATMQGNATDATAGVNKEMVKHLEIVDAEQHFAVNEKVGELLVIQGFVINKSPEDRELITVEANLYDENGVRLDTREQLIGNTLTAFQLENLTKEELEKALENQVGIVAENTGVKPGAKVPFMVLFYNPPQNVKEFQVIIVDAKAPPEQ